MLALVLALTFVAACGASRPSTRKDEAAPSPAPTPQFEPPPERQPPPQERREPDPHPHG